MPTRHTIIRRKDVAARRRKKSRADPHRRNRKQSRSPGKEIPFDTRSLPGRQLGRHETMSSIDSFLSSFARNEATSRKQQAAMASVYAPLLKRKRKLSTPVSKKSIATMRAGMSSDEGLLHPGQIAIGMTPSSTLQTIDHSRSEIRTIESGELEAEMKETKEINKKIRPDGHSNETSSGRETDERGTSESEDREEAGHIHAHRSDGRLNKTIHPSESGFVDDEVFKPSGGNQDNNMLETVPELHPLVSLKPLSSDNLSLRSLRRTMSSVRPTRQKLPVSLGIILVICFIGGGALLFAVWERWNIFDAAYFCFVTMTTIGFGDMVPGNSMGSGGAASKEDKVIACVVYLMFGVALIAMCFRLMQDDVVQKTKWIGTQIGLLVRESPDYTDSESDDVVLDIVDEAIAEFQQHMQEQQEQEGEDRMKTIVAEALQNHSANCKTELQNLVLNLGNE